MSVRLLLENFLGLMKEEGELDVFLPMLMAGMGHEIIFYAQKGVRQYGVDVVSVGEDKDGGEKKLFLWLIKCGNIGRTEWSNGNQAIRQSIDEVGDVFIPTHILPQHQELPRKLVILTNGEYQSNILLTLTQYLENWSNKFTCETLIVGGSVLASWTEEYLLDENVLPPTHHALFRRTLANVANPELCVPVGRQLFEGLFATARVPQKSETAQQKVRLTAFRALRTALTVIYQWAQSEGNLESARQLAEFAILEAWVFIQNCVINSPAKGNELIVEEFNSLHVHYLHVGRVYAHKISPYLQLKDSLSLASGDALVTADLAFRELGQFGLQGIMWRDIATVAKDNATAEIATQSASASANDILTLLSSHQGTRSPAFDSHILDIHPALMCLISNGQVSEAATWLRDIVARLGLIVNHENLLKYWPLHADFTDALEVRHNAKYPKEEFLNVSTLVPILLLWCAALGLRELYDGLRNHIIPKIPDTTLNMWSSDERFDAIVNNPGQMHASGFGESISDIPEDPEKFIQNLQVTSKEIPALSTSSWYQARVPFIPLLAARHWKLQIPKQMLVEDVINLCRKPSIEKAN